VKRITITLPEEVEELVRYEAERQGSTISEIIREAVVSYLTDTSPREVPWAGMVDDPTMTAASQLEETLRSWPDAVHRRRR
jgi:metal-responsive CopG/Arc/MetJ family transcriptional regulator